MMRRTAVFLILCLLVLGCRDDWERVEQCEKCSSKCFEDCRCPEQCGACLSVTNGNHWWCRKAIK